MRKPVLLLDFDGTLVKLNKPKAFCEVVKKYALKEAKLEWAKILYQGDKERCAKGKYDRRELFDEFLCEHEEEFKKGTTKDKLCDYFWDQIKQLQEVKDGCYSTLDKLRGNYTLVCVTDTDGPGTNKKSRIKKAGLSNYFSWTFVGSEGEPKLPPKGPREKDDGEKYDGIEYIKSITEILGVNPDECIMIGDKIKMDLEPAKKVGMPTILVKNSAYAGTLSWEVVKLSELIPLINQIVESKLKPDTRERKPRFSKAQYDMLKRCSDKKDMTEWNTWREKYPWEDILLQDVQLVGKNLKGANLKYAHLENADLSGTILDNGTSLWHAHLQGADLNFAQLTGCELSEAKLQNVKLFGAHIKEARLEGANLEYADLEEAYLVNAVLDGTYMKGANLCHANLRGAKLKKSCFVDAKLKEAHLEGANLENADLKGTDLRYSHLEGASLIGSIVDGSTLVWECLVDHDTDFHCVGLENSQIDAGLKQILEYNIRRMNWEAWYKEHFLLRWPVWLFWLISDYGLRTWRIIMTFFGLAITFAVVYWLCPSCVMVNGVVGDIRGFWHALYFSVVTMTTLGFGDIAANPDSWVGQTLLMLQVILGYVLLGALVTRFAVLFTAGGPAGRFANEQEKKGQGE